MDYQVLAREESKARARLRRLPVLRGLPVFFEALKIAVASIMAHKLRSFLTLIGIIIGVASVMVVGAFISGMETYVTENVTSLLGSHTFIVAKIAGMNISREDWEKKMRTHKDVLQSDYESVLKNSKLAEIVAVDVSTRTDLRKEGRDMFDVRFVGCTSNLADISNISVGNGRFLVPFEVDHARPTCVVGWAVMNELFPDVDPVGKLLKVKDVEFTIAGVLAKRGSFMGNNLDTELYIPYTVFQKIFGLRRGLSLRIKTLPQNFEAAQGEVRQILRNKRHMSVREEDDFDVFSTDEINQSVEQLSGTVAAVVTPVTCIALLVGGIVIMNIMLVSVTERTKEIGIRKAIGARRKDLLLQFLLESSIMGLLGGGLGIALSYSMCWFIVATWDFSLTITGFYIALSLTVSGGVGMVAGMYPAFKASRLDPIAALAFEN